MGCGSSIPMTEDAKKKQVVVLGGGYTGLGVAQKLKAAGARVTVIDPRDTVHHNIGAPRALVKEGFAKATYINRKLSALGIPFIHGRATKVDKDSVSVKLAAGGEDTIKFDALVVATGSIYGGPFKSPSDSERESLEVYAKCVAAIREANKVVVIGGGPVGCETAGEIISEYPRKDVTVVHSRDRLLTGANNGPSGSLEELAPLANSVKNRLQDKGVRVLLSKRIRRDEGGGAGVEEIAAGVTKGDQQLTAEDGSQIEADLVIWALGCAPNSEGLPRGWLDAQNRVKVDDFLRVEGTTNVFSLGDVCNADCSKTAFQGDEQAALVAKNIGRFLSSGEAATLDAFVRLEPALFVTIGPQEGAARFPNGMLVGRNVVSMIKGGDLFTKTMWSNYGVSPIPVEKRL